MSSFDKAFNLTMQFEVGPWFNDTDTETVAGLCETKDQKRKTGYVFIKGDRGEETKFGVAQAANPDLDIKKITLADAKKRYEEKYWNASKADQLQEPVSLLHFDAAVNHGVGRAVKFLQQALQVTVDGDIGPKTLAAAKSADQIELGKKLLEVRKNFFLAIVARDPSQKKFLNGWLNRIEQIKKTIKI